MALNKVCNCVMFAIDELLISVQQVEPKSLCEATSAILETIGNVISVCEANVCNGEDKLLVLMDMIENVISNSSKDELLIHSAVMNVVNICAENVKISESTICNIMERALAATTYQHFTDVASHLFNKSTQMLLYLKCSNTTNDATCQKIQHNLIIAECLLKVILVRRRLSDGEERCSECIDNLFSQTLTDLAMKQSKVIGKMVLLNIFPKLLEVKEYDSSLLHNTWNCMSKEFSYTDPSNLYANILFILCSLADFYFTSKLYFKTIEHNCLSDDTFWQIIQKGLVSDDATHRKEALYLLKRAVDIAHNQGLRLSSKNFLWSFDQSKSLFNMWETIFIVLEVLEEKQSHLVLPVLPSVLNLFNYCINDTDTPLLHMSWVLCIFDRIFSHDSITIKKWGVKNFFIIDPSCFQTYNYLKTLKQFLKAFNSTPIFSRSSDKLNQPTEIEDCLTEWMRSASNARKTGNNFFANLMTAVSEISWGPVPLFHLMNALSLTPVFPSWDEQTLTLLSHFVVNGLATQSIYIRGAIQSVLLYAVTKLTAVENIKISTVAKLLASFKSRESLKKGTEVWFAIVGWLKGFINEKTAEEFVVMSLEQVTNVKVNNEISVSSRALARMLVLLCDAKLVLSNNDMCLKVLYNKLSLFKDVHTRSYICVDAQNKCLELIICVIKECQPTSTCSSPNLTKKRLLSILSIAIKGILVFIRKQLHTLRHLLDFHSIEIYLSALKIISTEPELLCVVIQDILRLQQEAIKILISSDVPPPIMKYFSARIVSWSVKMVSLYPNQSHLNSSFSVIISNVVYFIEEILKRDGLNDGLSKDAHGLNLTRDMQSLWGRIVSGYVEAKWTVFAAYLYHLETPTQKLSELLPIASIATSGMEAFQVGGWEVLPDVLETCKFILYDGLVQQSKLYEQLIFASWQACFELRKLELFWVSIRKWMEMVYQLRVISECSHQELLRHYSNEIFSRGESVNGLTNLFLSQLRQISAQVIVMHLLDSLVAAALFGPIHRHDEKRSSFFSLGLLSSKKGDRLKLDAKFSRIENETCTYIHSLGHRCAINVLNQDGTPRGDGEVRMVALDILLYGLPATGRAVVINRAIQMLFSIDGEMNRNRQRYFGDSLHHRVKNRILQALLLLETALWQDTVAEGNVDELLLGWVCDSLLGESHQPSIRYQLEWLLIRLLLHYENHRNTFWTLFSQASSVRVGSICSYISIAYHVACFLDEESFIDRCVQEILPWSMAQQFNLRLYSQVVLEKLLSLNDAVRGRYAVLGNCLSKSLTDGNAVRNALKLRQDFYFTVFKPLGHFSLETLFWDLPRLSNMACDEWVPISVLQNCFTFSNQNFPMRNSDTLLAGFRSPSWVVKATDTAEISMAASGVQKKFIPWRSMLNDRESAEEGSKNCSVGLVVVASLIDRAPNLGGLARSCEVFAAQCLVLSSLDLASDKQFTSLSMSAEKHLEITEVKVHNLAEYFIRMKQTGYCLIGVEQTAGSVNVSQFPFPVKSLLLLGNEKEGIPANLLPFMDICVEIPQQGLIRSLNVHVTGAIVIWEYSKQHKFKKSAPDQ